MGEVVDVRPDRFLHELRDHGDPHKACEAAGISSEEINDLAEASPEFDLARVECVLQHTEDLMQGNLRDFLGQLRASALKAFRIRHLMEQNNAG